MNITSGTIARVIFMVLFFAALFIVRDIVLVVLASVVIASSTEPFTRRLKTFGLGRVPSVILLYLALIALLASVIYFFLPSLLSDTSSFLSTVPSYLDKISLWDPLHADSLAGSKQAVQSFSENIDTSKAALQGISSSSSITQAMGGIQAALSNVSEGFIQTMSLVFGGVLSAVLIVVLSFYLSVQEDGVAKFLRIVTPLRHERYAIDLWKRVEVKIGRWFQGQLLLALLVGVLVYLVLTIFGVRNALLLSFLAALFETIPLFGPILAAIPGVAVAYLDSGLGFALVIAGMYLIIQQFENHLIYPLVVKKIVGVPPILVILALIIGFKLAGFIGVILSVPIATTLMEYLDDLQKNKLAGGQA